jgi:hypothetical protein
MKIALPLLIALTLLSAQTALAADDREMGPGPEDRSGVWGLDAEATSASLARDGWKFQAMSTMSWPDGRQALVTMWVNKLGDFARCFQAAIVEYGTPMSRLSSASEDQTEKSSDAFCITNIYIVHVAMTSSYAKRAV